MTSIATLHTTDITAGTSTDESTVTTQPLNTSVKAAMKSFFAQCGDTQPSNVYEMVLAEIERPLLEEVMGYTRGNQSKAAIILGISRGTLRKKLKIYDLE